MTTKVENKEDGSMAISFSMIYRPVKDAARVVIYLINGNTSWTLHESNSGAAVITIPREIAKEIYNEFKKLDNQGEL